MVGVDVGGLIGGDPSCRSSATASLTTHLRSYGVWVSCRRRGSHWMVVYQVKVIFATSYVTRRISPTVLNRSLLQSLMTRVPLRGTIITYLIPKQVRRRRKEDLERYARLSKHAVVLSYSTAGFRLLVRSRNRRFETSNR